MYFTDSERCFLMLASLKMVSEIIFFTRRRYSTRERLLMKTSSSQKKHCSTNMISEEFCSSYNKTLISFEKLRCLMMTHCMCLIEIEGENSVSGSITYWQSSKGKPYCGRVYIGIFTLLRV